MSECVDMIFCTCEYSFETLLRYPRCKNSYPIDIQYYCNFRSVFTQTLLVQRDSVGVIVPNCIGQQYASYKAECLVPRSLCLADCSYSHIELLSQFQPLPTARSIGV